ncbi:M28 family peptidase [Rhizobium sp. Leaf383]|uniref:M28 family peptidase n=1 Tax=Rhizobium sp. Leaf383 TaxID=1736357 RepID=UPI000714BEE6|nr:M28 family peptidase [Rhizobium sp. Leaf383]KQS84287.1 hypothetical protein ASG58_21185 [Rhizobium sp. Leaf383]
MTQKFISEIMDLFSYCRPMGSDTEREFVNKFLLPRGFEQDRYGNMVLTIGNNPRILFSSHMDTVHKQEGRQVVQLKDGILTQTSGSSCLGADDTAGIWLMLQMVAAGIEGVYVIHYGEECGGVGSGDLARKNPEFFKAIDIAIAFDRAGYADIITHQMGGRTASTAFATSLAKELGGSYKPCANGIYTDTAEYAHLVAECTNISVGYARAHGPEEQQDVTFLIALREALLQVDWSKLVVERTPHAKQSSNHRERRPQALGDLCWDYPEIAAAILEAFGVSAQDFAEEVESQHGIRIAA